MADLELPKPGLRDEMMADQIFEIIFESEVQEMGLYRDPMSGLVESSTLPGSIKLTDDDLYQLPEATIKAKVLGVILNQHELRVKN